MMSRNRFLKACHCEKTDRPPVWLMRQAGRYLPEYQAIRAEHSFIEMVTDEKLITEISLQPWRRFKMDAVIVFSDILLLPMMKGMELKFLEGQGPKFPKLLANNEDLKNLKKFEEKNIPFLLNGLHKIKTEIKEEAALIGFAGSPWTVASYTTQNFSNLRKEDPQFLKAVLEHFTEETVHYLKAKIGAGCDAIQIFDSWGGILSPKEYQEWSAPYIATIIEGLKKSGVPIIIYVKESAPLLEEMKGTGADVISVDWETSLEKAKKLGRAIQGNLSPHILMRASPAEVAKETQKMLETMRGYPGYIANLGHGVLPKTPVANVETFVKICQQTSNFQQPTSKQIRNSKS